MQTLIAGIALLGIGNIINYFYPLTIPSYMVESIVNFSSNLYALDGFLPVTALINVIVWDIYFIFAWIIFKLVMNSIGGKPDIE